MKYYIWPTWALMRFIQMIMVFPKGHPFNVKITLDDWTNHATGSCAQFALLLWTLVWGFIITIFVIIS